MQALKKKLEFPNIPIRFIGRFPKGHINNAKGWNFSQQELQEAAGKRQMLTMDWDMYGRFSCSARCDHCFEKGLFSKRKKPDGLLSDKEAKQVITDAKALGLRTVKIIGPGEPLENRSLLDCLDFLAEQDIQPLIFTKGTAFGDSSLSRRIHMMDSGMLARKLRETYDVTINLGANSFHPETQEMIVKRKRYSSIRNRAMELLSDAGFNEFIPGRPTSFALIFNPITLENMDEVFEVYTWARRRHIYVISSPTMVAGSCGKEENFKRMTPPENELLDLYVRINLWALEKGIHSLGDLERIGVSAYAGACPCQQIGAGLFIRRDGLALRCPGDDTNVQGRIQDKSLADIWYSSENLNQYGGIINVGCPPKQGKSIPNGFFDRVLERLRNLSPKP